MRRRRATGKRTLFRPPLEVLKQMDKNHNGRLTVSECLSFGLSSGLLNTLWIESALIASPCTVVNAKRHLDHLLQKLPGLVKVENEGDNGAAAQAYLAYFDAQYEGNPIKCAAELMAEKPPKGSRVFPALTSETLRAMTGKPSRTGYWTSFISR